jgi:hypothetical protein
MSNNTPAPSSERRMYLRVKEAEGARLTIESLAQHATKDKE